MIKTQKSQNLFENFPEKKYDVIYMDPPWSYRDKALAGDRGSICKYPVLSVKQLKTFPIQSIAADDCALFMWATMPMLPDALKLLEFWDFNYKTNAFTWIKKNKKANTLFWGMGNFTRCLHGDTKVWLSINGHVKIATIREIGDYSLDHIKIWTPFGWRRILNWVKNENTEITELETVAGPLICSENHKHPIWMKENNYVRLKTTNYLKTLSTIRSLLFNLDNPIVSENIITNVSGQELTKEFGYLIGMYCARGGYYNNGYKLENLLTFNVYRKSSFISDCLECCLKQLKEDNKKIRKNFGKKRSYEASILIASEKVYELLNIFTSGRTQAKRRLNLDLILQTSVEFREQILLGMLDGNSHDNSGTLCLEISNKNLLVDFRNLAFSLGYLTSFRERKPRYVSGTLCFAYKINFIKRGLETETMLGDTKIKIRTMGITKYTPKGVADTYDISVDGEYFIANNIITHNSNSELCLLAVKGKPKRVSASVHSVIMSPIEEHSKKPDEARNRIKTLMGDNVSCIELFARQRSDGWDVWGDELPKLLEIRG